ncbi:MAG: transporter substrate-binding domain-containing protein [Lachnospiraceae bacterium]|nr:transporter substrate-binding domain-containing protein [Lachnospiraceae bacterium]
MKKNLTMLLAVSAITAAMTTGALADEAKTFKIATDTVFKPFEYPDENGEQIGIDMEILEAIAKDQGFEYTMDVLGWDASIAACQAGQADGMIAGASITDERKENGWQFSDGYFYATQSIAVKGDSDIKGFDDLKGQTVGAKIGTQGETYALSLADEYGFNVTSYEDSPSMYQAVIGGQAVACFEDTPIMITTIEDQGLDMKVVEGTANEGSPYGLAVFSDDEQELLDLFNAGLANIVADGTYEEIVSKYLGEAAAADAVASFGTAAETEAE